MAQKLKLAYETGRTVYALAYDYNADIWNSAAFVTYATANRATYDIPMTELGTASGVYTATFPVVAAGSYSVIYYEQLGASPAESDTLLAVSQEDWDGAAFMGLASVQAHGDTSWDTVVPADVAAAILVTPAQKLVTDSNGYVTAENMRGTDSAYTGTPPTASDIATAVWAAGTRTLTSFGTLAATVATAVWASATRTLSAFGFTVTATDVSTIKAVTDKLDTALEADGAAGYQFTTLAVENAPSGGDATAANQTSILAAITALNDLSSANVATAVQGAVIDGALTLQDVLKNIHSKGLGKAVRTGTDPTVVEYYAVDGTTLLFTLTVANDNTGRTVA